MISSILSRIIILLFGTLYPAYASYKAVRTKNVKEYVKWMMYWIVFAFFTCIETFTDIFLAWFPFYYEIKVLVVIWLLSPATKGSSTLYRKFVHPMLTRREQEIDDYITQAKEKGYTAVLQLGSKGVNYATNVIMQTAIKVMNPQAHGLASSQSDGAIASSSSLRNRGKDVTDGDAFQQLTYETHRSQSLHSVLYDVQPLQQQQLYEIDSEEEDTFLRFDRGGSRPPCDIENDENLAGLQNQNRMDVVIEESDLLSEEEGAAKTRAAPKRKTRRVKAKVVAKPTGSPRARRKLRKDSDIEVDVC